MCACVLCSVANVTPGHSNRVFSLKFDPSDDNTIVSGGWDNTVQVRACAYMLAVVAVASLVVSSWFRG